MKKFIYTSSTLFLAMALLASCGGKSSNTTHYEQTAAAMDEYSEYPADVSMAEEIEMIDMEVIPSLLLADKQFTLVMNQKPWSDFTIVEERPYFLINEEGHISGFAGCNRLIGSVNVNEEEGDIVFILGSTMMACEGEKGDLERAFMQAMNSATNFELVGNVLTLKDKEGNVLIEFQHPIN
jgi:heat shock protein HslJ